MNTAALYLDFERTSPPVLGRTGWLLKKSFQNFLIKPFGGESTTLGLVEWTQRIGALRRVKAHQGKVTNLIQPIRETHFTSKSRASLLPRHALPNCQHTYL